MSPPGGGIRASPKRASSGPASRNEARIRAASASSTAVSVTASACRLKSLSPVQSAFTPRLSSSAIWVSTSRIRGTFESTHLLGGEQAGGEDRQRRVLVAGGDDLAGEGRSPLG